MISEAEKGDAIASEARLQALVGIRVLALDARAKRLAATLVGGRLLPAKASADAEHIALHHGMDRKIRPPLQPDDSGDGASKFPQGGHRHLCGGNGHLSGSDSPTPATGSIALFIPRQGRRTA